MKKLLAVSAITLGLTGCGLTDTLMTRYAAESTDNYEQLKEKRIVVVNSKMSSVVDTEYFTNVIKKELEQKGFVISEPTKLGQPEVAAVLTIQKRVDALNSPELENIEGDAGATRGSSQGTVSRMGVEAVVGYYASLDWFDINTKEKLMTSTVAVTDTECSEKTVSTFLTKHLVEKLGVERNTSQAYSVKLPDGLSCK